MVLGHKIVCSVTFCLGVHLDESSSPVSKHFDEDWDDIVNQLSNPRQTKSDSKPDRWRRTQAGTDTKTSGDGRRVHHRDKTGSCTGSSVVNSCGKDMAGVGVKSVSRTRQNENKYFLGPGDSSDSHVVPTVNAVLVEEDEGLGIKEASSGTFTCDTTPEESDSEQTDEQSSTSGSKSDKKDSKKRRFRRMISGPLRRSHSAGCEKDLQVPAHALFLQYDVSDKDHPVHTEESEASTRRMVHKTASADAAMMAQEDLPGDSLPKSKSKTSLAKNVKRKIQAMRRRNTDSALVATFIRLTGSSVSRTHALEWSKSLETLINDRNGVDLFRNFLKSEFSEENLEFWLACEQFKSVKTNKLAATAQNIYSEYVAVKSSKEVNLDSETRMEVKNGLDNPTRTIFNRAQKRIQLLMEKDSYPRFLESDVYRHLTKPRSQDI